MTGVAEFFLVIAAVLIYGRIISMAEDRRRALNPCPPHQWEMESDAAGTSYYCAKCGQQGGLHVF